MNTLYNFQKNILYHSKFFSVTQNIFNNRSKYILVSLWNEAQSEKTLVSVSSYLEMIYILNDYPSFNLS